MNDPQRSKPPEPIPGAGLTIALLWLMGFCLAVELEPRLRSSSPNGAGDALSALLGDSRRLLAKHLYVKADAYFHSGYYPSVFDRSDHELHLSTSPQSEAGEEEAVSWLGKPKDWLDRFGRHFYPSEHCHLGEGHHEDHHGHDHGDHDHGHHDHGHHDHAHHDHGDHDPEPEDNPRSQQRELLPWLRLSAALDPDRAQTYVVGSYWLRTELGRVRQAEQFLREGLRTRPGHPELLFEFGRIYRENHHDNELARNIWEVALKNWLQRGDKEREENPLLTPQLLGNLAQLEEEAGRYREAIGYLRQLIPLTPHKAAIEKWIGDLDAKRPRIPSD